ncbi:hypothetical protein DFH08DRAFT_939319 [Mycena albidolilacea]|uniref:Uncharacterized protein n=1 Tax=Mycena albidolilacea TaxID=1033008 RepID=A0AAD6ZSZ0_9AGAR|nr:hypothetical protein DFH08DRAFT_939319 [Mycena albidolilacea]
MATYVTSSQLFPVFPPSTPPSRAGRGEPPKADSKPLGTLCSVEPDFAIESQIGASTADEDGLDASASSFDQGEQHPRKLLVLDRRWIGGCSTFSATRRLLVRQHVTLMLTASLCFDVAFSSANSYSHPHLTFGCEVSLDITLTLREKLEDVQHEFLHRLLGLHRCSMLAVLFSETGVIPVHYRRASLAVGYLHYLLSLPSTHLAKHGSIGISSPAEGSPQLMREVDSGDGRAASACPVTDRMEDGYWSAAILDEATLVSPRSGACSSPSENPDPPAAISPYARTGDPTL